MTDPLDAYGDALRSALHAETRTVFVCNPAALEEIRARTERRARLSGYGHDLIVYAALALLLLFTLGGS